MPVFLAFRFCCGSKAIRLAFLHVQGLCPNFRGAKTIDGYLVVADQFVKPFAFGSILD